jgi:UPF0716 protein FxsA
VFWKLLLAFTIVPALELYLLVSIGQWIGPLATVLLIVLTGLIGAALAKREGVAVLRQLRADLGQGLPPAAHVVEGVMVLAGGLLLLTPGLLTDLTGFTLIFPLSRKRLAPWLTAWLVKRFRVQVSGLGGSHSSAPVPEHQQPRSAPRPVPQGDGAPFDHPVR